MAKTFYITTAIDYTNSAPHIGHAYEKVLADVIARYHRLKGEKVFFLTGVDQHGQKVHQSAAKAGVAPAEFVKGITEKFVDLWKKLDVQYDAWAATTDPLHKKCVQGILQRLFDEGQIYKDKQAGHYSVRQEQFLTDKERGPDGEFGPEFREEENYYFRLSKHKEWLLTYIDNRKNAIIPDFRQIELRNAVGRLSGDLCISRPKSRLDWGIELPFDKDFVNYVWFDALTNYISFAGYDSSIKEYEKQPQEFLDRWPALQIIGKDILIPAHGIYWLIMLHAIGFPDDQMPQLLVHGWWNLSGAKMSKSAGNVIDPDAGTDALKPSFRTSLEKYNEEQAKKKQPVVSESEMLKIVDRCAPEAFRYYLISDIVTGRDANFSQERLISRYNNDLANKLGNLLNRTLSMAQKYRKGRVAFTDGGQLQKLITYIPKAFEFCMDMFAIGGQVELEGILQRVPGELLSEKLYGAMGQVESLVDASNQFIDHNTPWKMARNGEDAAVGRILYQLAESLRVIAILISPVLPKAAHEIFDQLNWKMEPELSGNQKRFQLNETEWGKLPDGHVVGQPVPLFPRIER
jgi:methionyl-tRNA synthetase